MNRVLVLLATAVASTTAQADSLIVNTENQKYTVSYTLASGENVAEDLDTVGNQATEFTVKIDRGKSRAVKVMDARSKVISSATLMDDTKYLLLKRNNTFVLEPAGATTRGHDVYAGLGLMSLIPGAEISLFGAAGQVGVKKFKLATKFDLTQVVDLPTGDDVFWVELKLPDGTTARASGSASRGRYHVVHKTYDDKLVVSQLGFVPLRTRK